MDVETVAAGALELGIFELLRQRLIKEIAVPAPVAGSDWSAVVPAGVAWELLSVTATFATSAVVANRAPNLDYSGNNGERISRKGAAGVVAASLTQVITFAEGWAGVTAAVANTQALEEHPLPLQAGWTVKSTTGNLDVGDQWSLIVLIVREWSLDAVERNVEWLTEGLR